MTRDTFAERWSDMVVRERATCPFSRDAMHTAGTVIAGVGAGVGGYKLSRKFPAAVAAAGGALAGLEASELYNSLGALRGSGEIIGDGLHAVCESYVNNVALDPWGFDH